MAKKILLPLFISSIVMPMDMVPIQSKWHLLAKDIVVGVANEIDLYSCDQLKQSCKHFHRTIDFDYYKARIIYFLNPKIAENMDVDTYTRNMIFLAKKENYYRVHKLLVVPHQNLNSLADRLWLATNRDNHYQTANLQYLVEEHNKKQKKQKTSIDMKELYKGDHLDALIDIFENNSCDNVMRLILHQRPDINAQNSTGNTLLHCAKHKHQYNSLLSQLKIDVNIQNEKGETPLHFAIKNPRWIPYTGPLHIGGAGIDEWGQAEALLKDVRTNVLLRTNKGKTVLHYAAQYASNRKKGFEYLRTDVTGFYI